LATVASDVITPFRVDIPDTDLADLAARLERTRLPDQIEGSGWRYGTDRGYLRELIDYWCEKYDWRAAEERLNRWPQHRATIDGEALHFAHVRGRGPRPAPLILSHGWPSSIFEFSKIAGPLSDPAAYGADPADAFDLVIPSLPGYGFSEIPRKPGVSPPVIARRFVELMMRLGYQRYFAAGGDYGARISGYQAMFAPEHVAAWHVTLVPGLMLPASLGASSHQDNDEPEGRDRAERWAGWLNYEMAYTRIQGTKPQSLAYGLNDSPGGLAAWITEKWRSWSDCGTDVESRFSKDDLLTNIAIYWFTGTINSSMRLYYESDRDVVRLADGQKVIPPAGFALESPATGRPRLPDDTPRMGAPSRAVCEQAFDVKRWTMMPTGGHFMALEEPEALVREMREFFRPYRAALA
jgi:pimeloyl-ACP methyl ester carboxylesterase